MDADIAVCLTAVRGLRSRVFMLSLTSRSQSRRERGRRAQQAFRQRQIDAMEELQNRNSTMQAAIASVARVATQLRSTV